jgi:hypothetical protein
MIAEPVDYNVQIIKLVDQARFVPFTILLSGGKRHEVTGPRQVAMVGKMIMVVLPRATHALFKKTDVVGVVVNKPAA